MTPQHLSWNPRAPQDGEITLVAGNPGSTNRLLTSAQRIYARDLALPFYLTLLSEYRGRLIAEMAESAEKKRTGYEALFGTENNFKALNGYVGALRDPAFAARLDGEEAALRANGGGRSGARGARRRSLGCARGGHRAPALALV